VPEPIVRFAGCPVCPFLVRRAWHFVRLFA
jgi:hypothetical protein